MVTKQEVLDSLSSKGLSITYLTSAKHLLELRHLIPNSVMAICDTYIIQEIGESLKNEMIDPLEKEPSFNAYRHFMDNFEYYSTHLMSRIGDNRLNKLNLYITLTNQDDSIPMLGEEEFYLVDLFNANGVLAEDFVSKLNEIFATNSYYTTEVVKYLKHKELVELVVDNLLVWLYNDGGMNYNSNVEQSVLKYFDESEDVKRAVEYIYEFYETEDYAITENIKRLFANFEL